MEYIFNVLLFKYIIPTSDRVVHNAQVLSRIFNLSLFDNQGSRHLFYSVIKSNGLLPSRAFNKLVPSETKENEFSRFAFFPLLGRESLALYTNALTKCYLRYHLLYKTELICNAVLYAMFRVLKFLLEPTHLNAGTGKP